MIQVEDLTKSYEDKKALRGIGFSLKPGKILGLLGPNGAGKTTTMRIMTGYLKPSLGDVFYDGISIIDKPREIKGRLGYLPEHAPLYSEFLVDEYMHFIAESRGIPGHRVKDSIDRVVSLCSLESHYYHPIYQLSKGFRQRVALAGTLIHDPDFIILDEPSTGLDPNQISDIRNLIRNLGKEKTLILSTHILQEVVEVCDHVVILSRGKKVLDSPVDEIRKENYVFLSTKTDPTKIQRILESEGLGNLQSLREHPDGYKDYLVDAPGGGSSEVFQILSKSGENLEIRTIMPYQRSLESIFGELTQKELTS